ncbi:uncharacterized protein V2V93DRAFT_367224 [Kockiozyma suomiensis]|uniref:uncharacterized protein n=1 Tax=Kockiozyma suomiensis TaxID=1337062 RepID=UPI003343B9FF
MAFLRGLRSRAASEPRRPEPQPLPHVPAPAVAPPLPQPFYRTLSAPHITPPPEYPPDESPLPPARFPVTPREEEGREPLPPYSATLVRAAVLSRKMELLSPLESAPVRSWTNVIVVLNNTQLQVYKAPAAVHPPQAQQQPVSGMRSVRPWRSASASTASNAPSLFTSLAELPIPLLRSSSSSGAAVSSQCDTINPFACPLLPSSASSSEDSLSPSSSASSASSTDFSPEAFLSLPADSFSPSHLLRSYTLQYAQIGLATDYKKKSNVIRVRAEGQQFLLLCADARECVEWTAAMQVACDLALPLDERTIPRFRSIPSRRHRRVLPSARHPSSRASRRASEPVNSSVSSSSMPPPPPRHSSLSAATPPTLSDLDEQSALTNAPLDPPAPDQQQYAPEPYHEEDDDDEDLYYRRSSATANSSNGSNPRRRTRSDSVNYDSGDDEHDHDHNHDNDHDDSFHGTSPSTLSIAPTTSVSPTFTSPFLTRARRGSVPWSFATSVDENECTKWAPASPTLSNNSRLRYAIRCLYTLPANASWGDKLLMCKDDQFIVRERILA